MPVLTVFTPEVAAWTGEAETGVARNEMVERSFFNGADINGAGFSVNDRVKLSSAILSVPADPPFPVRNGAFSWAEKAPNGLIGHRSVEHGLFRKRSLVLRGFASA